NLGLGDTEIEDDRRIDALLLAARLVRDERDGEAKRDRSDAAPERVVLHPRFLARARWVPSEKAEGPAAARPSGSRHGGDRPHLERIVSGDWSHSTDPA